MMSDELRAAQEKLEAEHAELLRQAEELDAAAQQLRHDAERVKQQLDAFAIVQEVLHSGVQMAIPGAPSAPPSVADAGRAVIKGMGSDEDITMPDLRERIGRQYPDLGKPKGPTLSHLLKRLHAAGELRLLAGGAGSRPARYRKPKPAPP